MLLVLSAVAFLLYAFGIDHLGVLGMLGLAGALLALGLCFPWAPWAR